MKIIVEVKSTKEELFNHLEKGLKMEFENAGITSELKTGLSYKTNKNTYFNKPVATTVILTEFKENEVYQLDFQSEKYRNVLRISVADNASFGTQIMYEEKILDAESREKYLDITSKIVGFFRKRGIKKKFRAIDQYILAQRG